MTVCIIFSGMIQTVTEDVSFNGPRLTFSVPSPVAATTIHCPKPAQPDNHPLRPMTTGKACLLIEQHGQNRTVANPPKRPCEARTINHIGQKSASFRLGVREWKVDFTLGILRKSLSLEFLE